MEQVTGNAVVILQLRAETLADCGFSTQLLLFVETPSCSLRWGVQDLEK